MWDIRYRPLKFREVLGQEGTVQVLKARLKAGTAFDVSYIFSGGHGQGKTTLARILARALLCQARGEDGEPCNECDNCTAILNETTAAFSELDAASKGTIDNIRGIVDDLPFVIPGAPIRVYLFDEAHRMSRDAQDVLLKPLEDKKLIGIFCTTEPDKIRGAIRSRCEEYAIRKITREEILERVRWILEQEKVKYTQDGVLTVIDYCGGHVRDVINKLEMIAQMGAVNEGTVREYLDLSVISTYYEVLLSLGEPAKAVQLVEQACDRVGVDSVVIGLAEAAMNAFRLANGMFADFTLVDRPAAEKLHGLFGDDVIKLADHFLGARTRPTKVGLICDVLACSAGLPVPKAAKTAKTAPVVVQAPATPAAPEPTPEPAPAAPPPAAEAPQPAPGPSAAPVVAPALKPVEATSEAPVSSKRAGPGNLGSDDVEALTELDDRGVRKGLPRGAERGAEEPKVVLFETDEEQANFIPSSRFRQEFSRAWNHSRGSKG